MKKARAMAIICALILTAAGCSSGGDSVDTEVTVTTTASESAAENETAAETEAETEAEADESETEAEEAETEAEAESEAESETETAEAESETETETEAAAAETEAEVTDTTTAATEEDVTETTTAAETEAAQSDSGTYAADESVVTPLGRTYFGDDDILWCALSGTGAEFTFTGTKCEVEIKGDTVCMTGAVDNKARIAIYVDGERVIDDMVDAATETYTVFESDTEQTVDIKIVKLSEAAQSCFGIKSITVEGEKPVPVDKKDMLIEFVGDSITCGYGVDDEDRDHHFSTTTEDVTKTYAYKTAEALNADYSMVSYSGYGIISGYTSDGTKASSQLVPTYYNKVGFSYGSFGGVAPSDIEWSFERQADVVVINLGTNDSSYCKDSDKMMEYAEGYMDFIKQVRAANPNAKIICTLGTMGIDLCEYLEYAVITYNEETGDNDVYYLGLPAQTGSDGYAADWHPTEATHEKAAALVTAKIQEIMG